jgi:methionine biosynthesis protein MetW
MSQKTQRTDFEIIASMIPKGAKVLDVGCGDGALLALLEVDGRGIELSREGVNAAVARGLPVIQGDADQDLKHYGDKSFDYVILSQTLQATQQPKAVLENLLRIGQHVVISIPNFGHWRLRAQFFFHGRMPRSQNLPYEWYNTPNIHFCTLYDFLVLLKTLNVTIEQAESVSAKGKPLRLPRFLWNLFGEQAVFLIRAT